VPLIEFRRHGYGVVALLAPTDCLKGRETGGAVAALLILPVCIFSFLAKLVSRPARSLRDRLANAGLHLRIAQRII
jgi:hypothetical protein